MLPQLLILLIHIMLNCCEEQLPLRSIRIIYTLAGNAQPRDQIRQRGAFVTTIPKNNHGFMQDLIRIKGLRSCHRLRPFLQLII
ncbi:hypothetical protein D3C77_539180 [compost metagenome]